MYNEHLSIEEIEQLIQQKGPAENQTHVASCQECGALLEDCQAFNAKLDKLVSVRIGAESAMKCPDERVWFDVAGATIPSDESLQYVQHAAECSSCGQRLKTATRMFGEELSSEEERAITGLSGSQAEGTRQIIDGLAPATERQQLRSVSRKSVSWWRQFSKPALAFSALITVIAISGGSLKLYTEIQFYRAKESVRSAFQADRRMPYRPAVAPYGPNNEERGSRPSDPGITLPDSHREPCLAAEGELLRRHHDSAIFILNNARRVGNDSICILDDLLVAYALEGDYTQEKTLYERALDISREVISRQPNDPVVYFNRAMIYERMEDQDGFCESLQKFLDLEHGTGWSDEAKRLACK